MYYANESASDGQDVQNTWDSNYKGIWHLHETSGEHFDSSFNNNTGAPQNSPVMDYEGKIDGADDLDGSNDYINCGNDDSLELSDDFSISAWINPASSQAIKGILAKNTNSDVGYTIALSSDGKLRFPRWNSGAKSDEIPDPGVWANVVAVQDDGVNRLYVNGEAQSTTGSQSISTPANNFVIGRLYSNYNNYYLKKA